MTLQATSITLSAPRTDFELNEFEKIIVQKGRKVLFSKALQCPCKSRSTNQQSNCKNCGGSGWVFVNERETRMIVSGVAIVNEYKPWSEESRGVINISCSDDEQLTFMDKITLVDANAIYQEVLFFRKVNSQWFAFSSYPIKKLLYGGLFVSVNSSLQRVTESQLQFGPKNVVKIIDGSLIDSQATDDSVSLSVRYYHSPIYYVAEMKRETMQSFKYENEKETIQNLPLSALARRAHYILDPTKFSGEGLLSNDFQEPLAGCQTNCC